MGGGIAGPMVGYGGARDGVSYGGAPQQGYGAGPGTGVREGGGGSGQGVNWGGGGSAPSRGWEGGGPRELPRPREGGRTPATSQPSGASGGAPY